jgi:hypothetical protein
MGCKRQQAWYAPSVVKIDDLFIWVNHCAQREGTGFLEETVRSLDASDAVGRYEVWTHDPTEQNQNDWLTDRLRQAASMSKWFIRLENDVVVNRNLCHNVCNWSATEEPDFGLGLLFGNWTLFNGAARLNLSRNKNGNLSRKTRWIEGAQAQLFKSSTVERILSNYAKNKRELQLAPWYTEDRCMPDFWVSTGVFEACLATYIHTPSLVQHVGTVSTFGGKDASQIYSEDFDLNWKNDGSTVSHHSRTVRQGRRARLRKMPGRRAKP